MMQLMDGDDGDDDDDVKRLLFICEISVSIYPWKYAEKYPFPYRANTVLWWFAPYMVRVVLKKEIER